MKVYTKMKYIGLLLWATGCVRLYKDGDGFRELYRCWHPLTWLVLVVMTVPCAIAGEQLSYVVPIRLPGFWKDNIDQLQWVTPFTDMSTLKPFKHRTKIINE